MRHDAVLSELVFPSAAVGGMNAEHFNNFLALEQLA